MAVSELLSQETVEGDYGIPVGTQNVWRSTNRYGWRDISIKVGRSIRYKRADIEQWFESRKGMAK